MMPSFAQRATLPEKMDAPDADPAEVARTVKYIDFTHRALGGYRVIQNGLLSLLQGFPKGSRVRILDVGCGAGYQLKYLLSNKNLKNWQCEFTGMDLSADSIAEAQSLLPDSGVKFVCRNALDADFDYASYDIVICSLFLHHLSDEQISQLLRLWNKSNVHVLINDLHRSPMAWILFRMFALLTAAPAMARYDGALSVRKGFSRKELLDFCRDAGYSRIHLKWRWAFRYELMPKHE